MLNKIATLVKSRSHLALATCAKGQPHVSLMSFVASEGAPETGGEFWLATLRGTRKYANLAANPRASLLLDDRDGGGGTPGLALTVEVELRPFPGQAARERARDALIARHPALEGFLGQPDAEVLRLAALRYQLLTGLTEIFVWEPEKILDARTPID